MITHLIILAASVLGLGVSPFVEPTHEHEWVEMIDQTDGQAWLDAGWSGTLEHKGKQLELVLMRVNLSDPNGETKADFVMAVDCDDRLLGISEVYIHSSPGLQNTKLPITELEMDFASTPPSAEDTQLIDAACGRPDAS